MTSSPCAGMSSPAGESLEAERRSSTEMSGSGVGSTKVASLTNCCAGSAASENSDGETKLLRPKKITRRKTKSSVGVDGELKKEVSPLNQKQARPC